MKWINLLAIALFIASCSSGSQQNEAIEESTEGEASTPVVTSQNQLTEGEEASGWILMFDGETTAGWRGYGIEGFPAVWQIKDESLYVIGMEKRSEEQKAGKGDIIYDQEFQDFHLKLEWKISEAGNSGIFYLGQEDPELGPIYMTAPEMQVLDNAAHPDANQGKDGNRQAGSLYDLIPASPQNAKPAGEWNTAEVIKRGSQVIHKQNGEEVVFYQIGTDEWKELVSGSKFPGLNENWVNVAEKGYIGLQDHDNDVWFRNIKIKEL